MKRTQAFPTAAHLSVCVPADSGASVQVSMPGSPVTAPTQPMPPLCSTLSLNRQLPPKGRPAQARAVTLWELRREGRTAHTCLCQNTHTHTLSLTHSYFFLHVSGTELGSGPTPISLQPPLVKTRFPVGSVQPTCSVTVLHDGIRHWRHSESPRQSEFQPQLTQIKSRRKVRIAISNSGFPEFLMEKTQLGFY